MRESARTVVRLLLVATILMTGLSQWPGPTSAAEPTRALKIAALPFYSSAVSYIAQEQGFWKREGLDVTLLPFVGGPFVAEAVLSGSAAFGMGLGMGPATALTARGAKIVIVASEAYADETAGAQYIIVRHDSPITDVKQLEGKKVAVPAKGTGSHIFLELLKQRLGIKFDILELPSENQWVAVSRGDIDGAITETPFNEQFKIKGGRYLYKFPNRDVMPYYQMTVTIVTRKFADENPDVVKRVVKVIIQTSRWIMDNPEKARTLITNRLKYPPEVVALIHPRVYKFIRNADHMLPSIRWWGQQMLALGIIKRMPNYEEYYTTSYVDAALKDLGRVADPDYEKAVATPLAQR